MNLPAECRFRIYDFVFGEDEEPLIRVRIRHSGVQTFGWRMRHSLLSVSRQMRDEALPYVCTTLEIQNDCEDDSADVLWREVLPEGIRNRVTLVQSDEKYEYLTKHDFPRLELFIITGLDTHVAWRDHSLSFESIPYAYDPIEVSRWVGREEVGMAIAELQKLQTGATEQELMPKVIASIEDRYGLRCAIPARGTRGFVIHCEAALVTYEGWNFMVST